jgi:chemotaxis protein MotA
MDPATLAGLGLAFASVIVAMFLEGGSLGSLLLPAPLVLVFGGTIGAAIAGGLLRDVKTVALAAKRGVLGKPGRSDETIATVVSLAELARREGLLALEDAVKEVEDPFLADGLRAAIDGTDPDDLREILSDRIDTKRTADRATAKVFTDMGGYAPTVGIIGTVMSLVHVLENLSDPGELGHMIAAAFVATLWGVLTANLIWLPIASRLKRLSDVECAQMQLAVEGILSIQAGSNPRVVAQRLQSLVPPGELSEQAAA